MRKKVAKVFHMLDEDGSGVLDKGEVGLLQKKINKKFRKVESSRGRWRHLLAPSLLSHGMCLSNWSVSRLTVSTHDGQIEFDPPFDLDRDFAAMDEDGEGTGRCCESAAGITYIHSAKFTADKTNSCLMQSLSMNSRIGSRCVVLDWAHLQLQPFQWRACSAAPLQMRTGDDDPDVPVLPEYMVQKIDALVTASANPHSGPRCCPCTTAHRHPCAAHAAHVCPESLTAVPLLSGRVPSAVEIVLSACIVHPARWPLPRRLR